MKRIIRLALAALACASAGAGQAQDRYDNLDSAVNSIIQDIVGRGQLQGQSVFVGADDFFEKETGFDLRPRLSEMLHDKCRAALTDNGVRKLGMVESEAAWVLHGRWWRETHDSREYLLLRLFIAQPVEGATPPQEHEGEVGLVPIDENVENAVKPTLRHWGDSVVRQLERDLPGTGSRKYRLHIRSFEVEGAVAQPERLGRHLRNHWRRAFTGSRRFGLVGSTGFDGELVGEVSVADEHVEVALYVEDTQGGRVASALVTPDKGLFPPGVVDPGVEARLKECAGHAARAERPAKAVAEAVAKAVECYARMLKEAPGYGEALDGLERLMEKGFRDCAECPELVVVPSGTYMMGSPESESGRYDYEGPVHRVRIGRPFAVGVKEVTRGEFAHFVSAKKGHSMGDSCWEWHGEWKEHSGRSWRKPGFRQTDEHPVVCVSWNDAKAYVEWLSDKTGKAYRLLSEAEWEYVARGGTGTARYWGEGEAGQCGNANGGDEALKRQDSGWKWKIASCDDGYARTSPVGRYEANGFGLHDVLGNVQEWVEDCWNGSYRGAPSDGSAWESGNCKRRVVRGGSWINGPRNLRSAYRFGFTTGYRFNYVGFRVARTLTP